MVEWRGEEISSIDPAAAAAAVFLASHNLKEGGQPQPQPQQEPLPAPALATFVTSSMACSWMVDSPCRTVAIGDADNGRWWCQAGEVDGGA
nr:unnamed protein product [Digitaria exilis]